MGDSRMFCIRLFVVSLWQRNTMYQRFLGTAVLTLCLFFTSPFSWAAPEGRYGGSLVMAVTSDPRSFNPILAKETSTSTITGRLFEGLTATDPFDQHVNPNLAERWEVSSDGLVWTFFLREGLRWSDGAPLTADDVVFTFNDLIFNDAVPNSARDIFTVNGQSMRVEKLGPLTVRISLPFPFAPFLRSLSQEILPRHILQNAVHTGTFAETWGINSPPHEIVGSGAFVLDAYVPGQRVVLKRNPFYWKKSAQGADLPFLDKVVYLVVPSQDVELLKFLEGTIDAYGVRGSDYPLLKPLEKARDFSIHDLGPDMGSSFMVFNQNPGKSDKSGKPFVTPYKLRWFQNLYFRRAVAYAVDKDRIIDIVKNGLGYPQYSPESPATGFFYNEHVRRYDLDLDQARENLRRAGFVDANGDGFLEDGEGHPLEFNLIVNAGNNESTDTAGIIRHDLELLGMKVNVQLIEFNTLVAKLTGSFEWEAVLIGLTGSSDPHFGQNVWLSSGQLHMWHPQQEKPATAWEERIDALFSAGVQELDEQKRKGFYDEYQAVIAEQVPLIYTVLGARLIAVRNKFGNFKPAVFGGAFHNLEEIYLK